MKPRSTTVVRASHERLQAFVHAVARHVGIPEPRAALLARLLIETDLRGVFSHGSQQLWRYVREIRRGGINPQPDVQTVNETSTSLLLDGDGGLGYFPAYEGTLALIEKAREVGVAMMVTRSHGHIGAAGIYPRLAAEHGMCAFATSGVQLKLTPDRTVYSAASSPPMAFSIPCGDEPPLVVDNGLTWRMERLHEIQEPDLAQRVTQVALRLIGMGTICQTWGGLLAGLPVDPERAQRKYLDAHQGSMIFVFDPALFIEMDDLRREMDEFAQRVRQLQPVPGSEGAYLPGHVEIERERIHRRDGIPLSEHHCEGLQELAQEFEMPAPW